MNALLILSGVLVCGLVLYAAARLAVRCFRLRRAQYLANLLYQLSAKIAPESGESWAICQDRLRRICRELYPEYDVGALTEEWDGIAKRKPRPLHPVRHVSIRSTWRRKLFGPS